MPAMMLLLYGFALSLDVDHVPMMVYDQDATEAKIEMVSVQVTDVQLSGWRLLCVSDRLSLATSNMSQAAPIQDFLAQLFTFLPHTPVTACGINVAARFLVENEAHWHKIGHTLAPKDLIWSDLFNKPGMRSLVIQSRRDGEFPGEVNITVEPVLRSPPWAIIVRSNFHYGLPADSVHAGASERLLQFLKTEWDPACEMARRVAKNIFDKIKPDNG